MYEPIDKCYKRCPNAADTPRRAIRKDIPTNLGDLITEASICENQISSNQKALEKVREEMKFLLIDNTVQVSHIEVDADGSFTIVKKYYDQSGEYANSAINLRADELRKLYDILKGVMED